MKARKWISFCAVIVLLTGVAQAQSQTVVELEEPSIGFVLPTGWTSRELDDAAKAEHGLYAAQSPDGTCYLAVCAQKMTRTSENTRTLAKRYRASGRVAVEESQGADGTSFVLATERNDAMTLTIAKARANGYDILLVVSGTDETVPQVAEQLVTSFYQITQAE